MAGSLGRHICYFFFSIKKEGYSSRTLCYYSSSPNRNPRLRYAAISCRALLVNLFVDISNPYARAIHCMLDMDSEYSMFNMVHSFDF